MSTVSEGAEAELRIGLLLEGTRPSRPLYEAIERMVEEQPVSIELVGINEEKGGTVGSGSTFLRRPRRVVGELSRNRPAILIELDFVLAKALGGAAATRLDHWYTRLDVEPLLEPFNPEVVEYRLRPLDGEVGYEMPADVVDAFASKTDLVVSFEHAILKNDILEVTEHGVIGHHGGDIRRYRGRPVAIREFLNEEPEVGKSVQVLTPVLDGGLPVVIETRELSDYPTLWELKYKQKEMFVTMLADAVQKFRDPSFEPQPLDPVGELSHSSYGQRWSVVARVLWKMQKNRLLQLVSSNG